MSKIEHALRKAEEERRRKQSVGPSAGERMEEAAAELAGADAAHAWNGGGESASEHFRKIAAKLKSYHESTGFSDVVFTSAVSGEGKTTSAMNCAIALCRDFNLEVCLVDCDLRNPKVSGHFNFSSGHGIVGYLKGEAEIEEVIRPTALRNLSLVGSTKAEKVTLPMLTGGRFKKFINELKGRFDFVILDSAPILPVTDTIIISKVISAIILVIESGKTRRKHIEQTLEQIDENKIIGFVMNYKKRRIPDTYNYSKYYDYGPEKAAGAGGVVDR